MIAFPEALYKGSSKYSSDVRVVQVGKERKLLVDGFVQSVNKDCPDVEKRVWGRIAAEAVGLVHPKGEICRHPSGVSSTPRVLVLGMGGGTEIHLISQKIPEAKFTAVEIDAEIIKIARKFFGVDEIPNLEIINDDAFKFLRRIRRGSAPPIPQPPRLNLQKPRRLFLGGAGESAASPLWDLVICDLYAGGNFPEEADSDGFLRRLAQVSQYVIFNRIFESVESAPAQECLKRFKYYFSKVAIVPALYNALNILYVCESPFAENERR